MKKLTFKRLLAGYYDTGECLKRDYLLLCAMRSKGWFPYVSPRAKHKFNEFGEKILGEGWVIGDSKWKRDINACLDKLGR